MLRLILQVKPGSPMAHRATINLFGDPASLKMRLKIYLKFKKESSQQVFFEKIEEILDNASCSQPNPYFSDISDIVEVSDEFGSEYPLWIPSRGLNVTEINSGRDNPQQFLV